MPLTENKARIVIEKGVHTIKFSLDGTIQYGHVGGGADYDEVKDNIRRLARLKEEHDVKYKENLSLEQVWNSPAMRRLRWELDTGNYNNVCKRCPLLWNTIEGQEHAIPPHPLELQVAQLERTIEHLKAHIRAVQQGRVMRILRTVERLFKGRSAPDSTPGTEQ